MAKELEKGITPVGKSFDGVTLNLNDQPYFPKAWCDTTFAFETIPGPGQFLPVHIHTKQDEFILIQEGELDLKLDGVWSKARAGDLIRMPKGIPHGYFNNSDKPARILIWVSPAGRFKELLDKLHNMTDVDAMMRISEEHDIHFLPPEANE